MRLTFRPFEYALEKGKKLPVGTRRRHGDFWFKKQGDGSWKYDGTVSGSSSLVKPTDVQRAQARVQDRKMNQIVGTLLAVAGGTAAKMRKETTRRDRMSEGQSVSYHGNYPGYSHYRGKTGTLIAMGKNGLAVIRMPDGNTVDAKWKSVQAEGTIKPFSVYDGLEDSNFRYVSGKTRDDVKKIMDSKIGNSGITHEKLCMEFQKKGFTLWMVGGTIRDILQGKDSKDVDYITDCTENEMKHILRGMNYKWSQTWGENSKLGLVTIHDGGDDVDITPIHKWSSEKNMQSKGWNLKEDGASRDFACNSLQLDPLRGILVDATGKGIEGIRDNKLDFCKPEMLSGCPRYTLRAFKFIGRGYVPTPEAEGLIRANLKHIGRLGSGARERFLKNQIGEKDGLAGLNKFKAAFQKYDDGSNWIHMADEYEKVRKQYGG